MRRIHNAFTLIELLAVVSIVVILIAIILPVVNGVRERGYRVHCMNNLKQWGTGFNLYLADNNNRMPPEGSPYGYYIISSGVSGWHNAVGVYLGLVPLTNNAQKEAIFSKMKAGNDVRVCPSRYNERSITNPGNNVAFFSYAMNIWLNGVITNSSNGTIDVINTSLLPSHLNKYPGTPVNHIGDISEFLPYVNASEVVLVFDTPTFQTLGYEIDTILVDTGWQNWKIPHRSLSRLGGRENLRKGAGINILFLGGNVRFVTVDEMYIDLPNTGLNAASNMRGNTTNLIWNPWPYVTHRNP